MSFLTIGTATIASRVHTVTAFLAAMGIPVEQHADFPVQFLILFHTHFFQNQT